MEGGSSSNTTDLSYVTGIYRVAVRNFYEVTMCATTVHLLGVNYGNVDNVLLMKAEGLAIFNPVFNCTMVVHAKTNAKGGFKFAVHYDGDLYVSVSTLDIAEELQDTRESFGHVNVTFRRVHRIIPFNAVASDPCTATPVVEKPSIGEMRNSTGMRNASTEHLKYMASNFGIMPYPQNVSRRIGKTMVDLLGVKYGTVDSVLLIKVQGVAQYNHVFNATRVMQAKVHNRGGFRCAVHFNGDIFVSVRSSDVADDLEDTKESFGMVDVVFRRIHRLLCFEHVGLDPCTSSPIVSQPSIGMLRKKRKRRFSI